MSTFDSDARKAFAYERSLEPDASQVAELLGRFESNARHHEVRRRVGTFGAALAACAAIVSMSIPQSRAAITGGLSSFLRGGDPPGEKVDIASLPGYVSLRHALNGADPQAAAVLARANGLQLFAWRNPENSQPCFSLDRGDDMCLDGTALGETLASEHVVVLAATDAHGAGGLLWGIATDGAARVELQYDSGPPTSAGSGTNGFILPIDTQRTPRELVAYTPTGERLLAVRPDALKPLGLSSVSSTTAAWQRVLR